MRDLAGEIGGRLEIAAVIGGNRCIIVGPQPRAHRAARYMRTKSAATWS